MCKVGPKLVLGAMAPHLWSGVRTLRRQYLDTQTEIDYDLFKHKVF